MPTQIEKIKPSAQEIIDRPELSEQEQDFFNELSEEFLNKNREEIFVSFEDELTSQGREWFDGYRKSVGNDKAALLAWLWTLDDIRKHKLFEIYETRKFTRENLGIGLHNLGNILHLILNEPELHPEYFKHLPKN